MLQGDTRNIPLQNIFQTLDLNQQEGVLTIQFQKLERFIAIRRSGVSFLTEAPCSSRLLQQALSKLRVLTPAEYQNVFATATASVPPADLLLSRQLLTPQIIAGPIREQFLEFLYEIFAWQGVHYRFEVQSIPPERQIVSGELGTTLEFPVNAVLMEVARREDEWDRIRQVMPSPNQIYRFRPECEGTLPVGLSPERFQELTQLVTGQRTVDDIIAESSAPPFFVFMTLRSLILEGVVGPIDVQEKRDLAERMRLQLPPERLASIFQSILEDEPEDIAIRRKLLHHLEKTNTSARDLLPHYRSMAMSARNVGDIATTRDYLKKVLSVDARDMDCLEQLALLEVENKKDREFQQILRGYVEAVRKHREYERGASFLLDLVETKPGEANAVHEAAHLYLLAGKPKNAAATYERAAKMYLGRRDFGRLRNVVEKLEVCDTRAAARWRKHVATAAHGSGAGAVRKLAWSLILLLALGGGAFGVYEWDARQAYSEVFESAQRRAFLGNMDAARSEIEKFQEDYPYTWVGKSAPHDLTRLENVVKARQPGNSATPKPTEVVETPPATDQPVDAEREMSRAAALRRKGDYVGALHVFRAINTAELPQRVARNIAEQQSFLESYLNEAEELFSEAVNAEKTGNFERASQKFKTILERYPVSPVAEDVTLPVVIEVQPPTASVSLNGVPLEGESPFVVRVVNGDAPALTITAPSFSSTTINLDPYDSWKQQIVLRKQQRWQQPLPAPIETVSFIGESEVFVGTRSGQVMAFGVETGEPLWSFNLEGLGDALGAIRGRGSDILFTGTDEALYRVDCRTGKQVYRYPFPRGTGFTRVAMTEPDSDGRVYMVTVKGMVLAIDVDRPALLWTAQVGGSGIVAPQRIRNLLLVANAEGRVTAIDGIGGKELWSTRVNRRVTTPPHGNNRIIVIGTEDGVLRGLSPLNGKVVWEKELESLPTGVVLREDRLIVQTKRGEVLCYKHDEATPLWTHKIDANYEVPLVGQSESILTFDEIGVTRSLSIETGAELWTYDGRTGPSFEPGATSTSVLVPTRNNEIHFLETNGPLGRGGD